MTDKIKILPYNKELVKDYTYDGVEVELTSNYIIPFLDFYNKMGDVYVGMVDGKVLGVGGIYPLWQNSGGCFLFVNKGAKKYKIALFKILLRFMDMLIKKHHIRTLMVECIGETLGAHNLIKHLGFKQTHVMKVASYTKQINSTLLTGE